jgi:polysaccharide export outer membrane protein
MITREVPMLRSLCILCVVALLCVSSAAAPAAQTLQPKPPDGRPLYIIQPSDILEIAVWKEPAVSREKVLVRPDGRISIALAQDVLAAGLNPTQLKEKLEDILKEFLDVPVVTVIVTSISYRVYVTGNVEKGGPIMSESPLTVMQALAMAGNFKEYANKREIVILSGSGEDTRRFVVDFEKIIKGENFNQNMLLKSGDLIVVP